MNRKKQIEDILGSLDGMAPATPGHHVWEGVVQRLANTKRRIELMPARTVSLAAASILLLVLANLYFILQPHMPKEKAAADPMEEVINYYDLANNNGLPVL